MSFDNLELEIAAEFAQGGGREFFGEGYSFRKLGSVDGLDPKLVNALYWRKWRAENPERARAYVAAYLARDPERKKTMLAARKARWKKKHRDRYNTAQRRAYARRTGRTP